MNYLEDFLINFMFFMLFLVGSFRPRALLEVFAGFALMMRGAVILRDLFFTFVRVCFLE